MRRTDRSQRPGGVGRPRCPGRRAVILEAVPALLAEVYVDDFDAAGVPLTGFGPMAAEYQSDREGGLAVMLDTAGHTLCICSRKLGSAPDPPPPSTRLPAGFSPSSPLLRTAAGKKMDQAAQVTAWLIHLLPRWQSRGVVTGGCRCRRSLR